MGRMLIDDELFKLLAERAAKEHRTPDDVANDLLREALEQDRRAKAHDLSDHHR